MYNFYILVFVALAVGVLVVASYVDWVRKEFVTSAVFGGASMIFVVLMLIDFPLSS